MIYLIHGDGTGRREIITHPYHTKAGIFMHKSKKSTFLSHTLLFSMLSASSINAIHVDFSYALHVHVVQVHKKFPKQIQVCNE